MRAAILLLAAALALPGAAADGPPAGRRFAAMAFHDVVDEPAHPADPDAITTDRLVGYLEWIKASGIRPITLDDVEAAGRGERPLPERAVLITFDDGYRSLYTRVFPLVLAYRVPIVAALVGEWMDAPMDATVAYGGKRVPRRNFISWDEAREMAASGLVEFASHSYALHRTVRSDPHGTERPAAIARLHDARDGYETAGGYRERVASDLARSASLLRRELGGAPRALAWPFGRYRADALQAAREAGFRLAFTLEPGWTDAATPMALARRYPQGNPAPGDLARVLAGKEEAPARLIACVDPSHLAGEQLEARLGAAIDGARALGAEAVAIEAFARDPSGAAAAAWFPTREMAVRADVLSRIAWQLHTRANVDVYLRVAPLPPGLRDASRLGRLVDDLAASTWIDGIAFDAAPDAELVAAIRREYPAARSRGSVRCPTEGR